MSLTPIRLSTEEREIAKQIVRGEDVYVWRHSMIPEEPSFEVLVDETNISYIFSSLQNGNPLALAILIALINRFDFCMSELYQDVDPGERVSASRMAAMFDEHEQCLKDYSTGVKDLMRKILKADRQTILEDINLVLTRRTPLRGETRPVIASKILELVQDPEIPEIPQHMGFPKNRRKHSRRRKRKK